MWQCDSVTVWQCECVIVRQCDSVIVWKCDSVKVWKCDSLRVWESESVKVWECESVKEWVWKFDSVKVDHLSSLVLIRTKSPIEDHYACTDCTLQCKASIACSARLSLLQCKAGIEQYLCRKYPDSSISAQNTALNIFTWDERSSGNRCPKKTRYIHLCPDQWPGLFLKLKKEPPRTKANKGPIFSI